jgi:hypothetical protein
LGPASLHARPAARLEASASTGTWSPSVRINDDPANKTPEQRLPAIAVRSDGEAIAVWFDKRGNKENIYSARLPAGSSTWSTNMKVTTNTNTTKLISDVAFGPDGTAYAVWDEPRTGDTNIWFASLAPGSSTWSANTKVSDDPEPPSRPSRESPSTARAT